MWKIDQEIARVESLGLTEQEKQNLYYKNACKLFNIDQNQIVAKFQKDAKNTWQVILEKSKIILT